MSKPVFPSQRTPSLSPLAGFSFSLAVFLPHGRRLVADACQGESMIRLLIPRLVVKSCEIEETVGHNRLGQLGADQSP